jgi:hypothetical protein
MAKKQNYRIRNWGEYNEALRRRGSLTVWFDEQALQGWYESERSGRRGRSRTFSNVAIQCMLTLKVVYQLPLRATEGLLASLVKLMGIELAVPDYTTLSRRQQQLEVVIGRRPRSGPLHMVVDSTGLKIFGVGEAWPRRQCFESRRCLARRSKRGRFPARSPRLMSVVRC